MSDRPDGFGLFSALSGLAGSARPSPTESLSGGIDAKIAPRAPRPSAPRGRFTGKTN